MYINERDQINYHGFLRALREMNGVSQEKVSMGICTVSGMNRFENGNRVAEKLMRDRLTSRLGISGEKYEDYLQPKEYVRWQQRLRIIKALEKRDLHTAKEELLSYEKLPALNCVNKQFVETMRFIILSLEEAPESELLDCVTKALKYTVSNVPNALAGAQLLADQEINLIAEQIRFMPAPKIVHDEIAWRISEYEKLITYIENSCWEKLQQAKVYPKIVYQICNLWLEKKPDETECRRGLTLCHNAIELLRDTSRLYYFIELTETRRALAERLISRGIDTAEKRSLEEMLTENNTWEKVFKDLYSEYQVSPYMSDFCYLYYETECHNMVEVIETRRNMLGLSRVRLSDGICNDRTIIRFEREGGNPSIEMARMLFERLGLCAEYRRARVVTNDVEALMLSMEIGEFVNNYRLMEWENSLWELEQKLNLSICHNRQQILSLRSLLKLIKGEYTEKVYHDKNIEAIECSVPVATLDSKDKKYYTREELNLIFNQAFETKGELSEKCIEVIQSIVASIYYEEVDNFYVYELLINGYESYLGNNGKFDESTELAKCMLKECLANRNMETIINNLYNNIWNYLERCKLQKQVINIPRMSALYEQCIVISRLCHKGSWESFLQQKVEELVSI